MKELFKKYCEAANMRMNEMGEIVSSRKQRKESRPKQALGMMRTIVVAEKLTKIVQQYHNMQHKPVLILGDFFECAVYADVEFKEYFSDTIEGHADNLAEAVKLAHSFSDQIVICCGDKIEATGVVYALQRGMNGSKSDIVVFDETVAVHQYEPLKSRWKHNSSKRVLVVTDKKLPTLLTHVGIKDVDCVIHYSIPDVKGIFSTRFNLMSDLFIRRDRTKLSILLLRPQDGIQAHELVDLYERLGERNKGVIVPPQLLSLRNNNPRGLCRRFAATGTCPLKKCFCFQDHFIEEPIVHSLPSFVPSSGQLKFIVPHCTSFKSPSEFFIRLKAYRKNIDSDWRKVVTIEDFQGDLNRLRSKASTSKEINVGDMFAVIDGEDVKRVIIKEFIGEAKLQHYEDEKRRLFTAFQVDYGKTSQVERSTLIELSKKLKSYPPLAIKAYLTGVKPTGNKIDWTDSDRLAGLTILMANESDYMTGN
jgi:hypothetical protein